MTEQETDKTELQMIIDGIKDDWSDLNGKSVFETELAKSKDKRIHNMLEAMQGIRMMWYPIGFLFFVLLTTINLVALFLGILYYGCRKPFTFICSGALLKTSKFNLTQDEVEAEFYRISEAKGE